MKKEITKSLIFFLSAEIVFAVIFIFQGSDFAFFGAIALLLLTICSFGICFAVKNKISAKGKIMPSAEKGKALATSVTLANASMFPAKAICKISVKNRLTREETCRYFKIVTPAKGESKAEFVLTSEHCGYITAKIEEIYLTDIFGFLPLKVKNFSSAKGKTTVLPNTFAPAIVFDGILPVPEDSESYSADKKGYDVSEAFQIREYIPGDSIKQIHWKLSEKLDKTVVRDASLPIARNILVFCDKAFGVPNENETDAIVEVASSVTQSLLKSGYEFMLGWNDGDRIETAQIRTSEELLEAIPQMVKFSTDYDTMNSAEGLFNDFGKIVYIGKEAPKSLYEKTGASLILCNKALSGRNITAFDAENYVKDLEFLEFCV